jgi:hypothetical protein
MESASLAFLIDRRRINSDHYCLQPGPKQIRKRFYFFAHPVDYYSTAGFSRHHRVLATHFFVNTYSAPIPRAAPMSVVTAKPALSTGLPQRAKATRFVATTQKAKKNKL